jgi:hypothetical protein
MSFALILQILGFLFTVLAAVCFLWSSFISEKGENIFNYFHQPIIQQQSEPPTEIKKVDSVMIELVYKEPALMDDDECKDGVCKGEYILLGESNDSIRVDSPKCKEFVPESYNYDTGPYDPETGTYEKLISDYSGKEVRICGWFDLPKNRVISRQNTSYETSTEKRVWNYDIVDEFGSKVQQ